MAKGPKVSHPEYVDFNSDEDDLLGDDDLLVDNSSDEYYDETSINHANQDKTNDNDKEKIELLTKELNTLKLAHETIFEDHRELLRAHEKLRFEKLNLEQEHEFLKAINDDLRKKSSSYIAKHYSYLLTCLKSSLVTSTRKILPLVVTIIMSNPILLLLVVLLIPLMILLAKLHLSKKIAY